MNHAKDLVESYLNGNISHVKKKLKAAHKVTVLEFAQTLSNWSSMRGRPENGINTTIRLLGGGR